MASEGAPADAGTRDEPVSGSVDANRASADEPDKAEAGEPGEGEEAEKAGEPDDDEALDAPERPAAPPEPREHAESADPEAVEPEEPQATEPPGQDDVAALPITPAMTGPPVRASSMDSLTLPERSHHDADPRLYRPRRSAARLPALLSPVDIPEDAEGRIEFVVVRAGEDRDQPAPPGGPAAADAGRVRQLLTLGSGWAAVGGLASLLIIVFVVLELIFR